MKKTMTTLRALLAVAAISVSVISAKAAQYLDNDVLGVNIASGGQISGIFSIGAINDGSGFFAYDPSSSVLSSALAEFSFSRANSMLGSVEISIGGFSLSTVINIVNGTVGSLSGAVLGAALGDLAADGTVSYTIKNNSTTSIRVTSAALAGQAAPLSVPDFASTLCLAGMGLISLVFFAYASKPSASKV